jgi:fructosamine-3-kinase
VSNSVWQLLAEEVGAIGDPVPVAGGCINHCAVLTLPDPDRKVFAKTNAAKKLAMFEAEAEALIYLASTETVRVPEVISWGLAGEFAYLLLEHLPITGRGHPRQFRVLGEQLASLHRTTPKDGSFGWKRANFIGASPQENPPTTDWVTFFAENRIGFQLELAARSEHASHHFEHGDKLLAHIPDLLAGHQPKPSLLHGDLWSGNVGFTPVGTPIVFDPASYYGDRETDIAFSEMFGGFDAAFYAGYRDTFPLEPGYENRRELYNLYHVLNHYNLFGHSYGEQAEAMIRKLLVGF